MSQADNSYPDSLLHSLKQHPAQDSNRVTALLNIADAIIYNNADSAMLLANEAMDISEKISWQTGIALAYRQKGNVYYLLSDLLNAMDYFQKALRAGEPIHSKKFDASLFNNLANIYSDLKQYDKALDYYDKFYRNAKETNLTKQETIALINIGTVYTELGNFSKALEDFKKSLEIAEREKNERLIPFILNNIGITLNKKGDYQEALHYFQQSIQRAGGAGSENAKALGFEGIGKIYLHQGKYKEAENYAQKSLLLAQQTGSSEWQENAWQTLSDAYEKQHQYDKSLAAYKNYIAFRDSVSNEEKKSELTRKELQYEFEKKEALLKAGHDKKESLAAAAINRQRLIKNTILSGVLILLLAAIWSFVFYKRKRDAEELRKEAEFNAMAAETEMKALRLQMNPHFIFNTLNSIGDFISKHDTISADDYLAKFAKIMRMTLEYSDQKEIALADDLKMLELYLQLESRRLNHTFTYAIHVDDDIDTENTMVPPMMLQPFVENSIWHGIAKKNSQGKINIMIKKDADMIHCVVEDNGVGRKQSARVFDNGHEGGKKSFGIKITKARIDILNKGRKSKAGIELSDMEEGTRVDVKLPMN